MTNNSAPLLAEPDHPWRFEPTADELERPVEPDLPVTPVAPRLARGVVWSDLVAEMEQEQERRERDAA